MTERTKTLMTTFIIFIVGIMLYSALVIALPTGPDTLDNQGSERGNESKDAIAIEAAAGNVSEVDVNFSQITTGWQGYFGNITGNIVLTDASGDTFYNWSGLGTLSGEVYASRNNDITWTGINCTNATEFINENAFVSKAASEPDSVTTTFDQVNHPLFQVGDLTFPANTCNSTNGFVNGVMSATDYYEMILADTDGDIVYATIIDEDQTGFDGDANDFQFIVAENGNETESSTSTTYYFYIELS